MWKNKWYLQEEATDGSDLGGGSSSGVDWVAESNLELDEGPAPAPVAPVAPPAAEPKIPDTAPQAPIPEPVQPPAAAQPAQQPAQPPAPPATVAPTVPPVAAPPVQAPQDAEPSAADLQQRRTQFVATLEQQYALDEETADLALTDPGRALPKIAANLHANVLEAATYGIIEQLPRIIEAAIQARETRSSAEGQFYGKWDKLNTPEGRRAVEAFGRPWRQMNPTASMEEFTHHVGTAAMIALRIPIESATPPAPPAPPPRSAPPAPAAPGSAGAMPKPAVSTNIFTQIAEEMLGDDQN